MKLTEAFDNPNQNNDFLESSSSQLRKWQIKLLSGTLIIGIFLSLLVFGLSFFDPQNQYRSSLIIGSVILGFGSAILLLLKNFSFWLRSILCLVLFFLFVNTLFLFYGWNPVTLISLTGFVAISTTLLFRKSIRYGLIISVLTLVLWAALTFTNSLKSLQSSVSLYGLFLDSVIVCTIGFFFFYSIYQLKELYLLKIDENQEKVKEILEVNSKYQETLEILRRRKEQLHSLLELTNEFSINLSQEEKISRFIESLASLFSLPYVAVYRHRPLSEKIEIVYGTGDIGKELIINNHHFTAGGSALVSQANFKNVTLVEKITIKSDLGIPFDSSLENHIAIAIPLEEENKTFGVLLIIAKEDLQQQENDLLIFEIASKIFSYIMFGDFRQDISTSKHSQVLSTIDSFINLGKVTQYTYPEGDIIPPENISSANVIGLNSDKINLGNLIVPERELSQEEVEFLQELAAHLENALAQATRLTSMEKTLASENKSKEIASRFTGKKQMEEVLKAAAAELGKLPDVLEAKVALISPDETLVTPRLNGRKNDDLK